MPLPSIKAACAVVFCVALTGCSGMSGGLGLGNMLPGTSAAPEAAPQTTPSIESSATDVADVQSELVGVVVPTPPVSQRTQDRFSQALELMRAGEHDIALTEFEALTEQHPELAGPWVNLGIIYEEQGQLDKAGAAYEAALQANPHNCDARIQAALLAREQGQFPQAEQHYLACMNSQPGYAAAYRNVGILYELYMGRLDDALVMYGEYQSLLNEPDAQVAGWMSDLERRVSALARR